MNFDLKEYGVEQRIKEALYSSIVFAEIEGQKIRVYDARKNGQSNFELQVKISGGWRTPSKVWTQ